MRVVARPRGALFRRPSDSSGPETTADRSPQRDALAHVAAVPPRRRLALVRAWRSLRSGLPARLLATVAIAVVLGGAFSWQEQRLRELERLAEPTIDRIADAARGRAGTRLVPMTTVDGDPVPLFVDADGRAYLDGSGLPVLSRGRTYQLWGATEQERVSLAVLGQAPGVEVFRLPGSVGSLAVTVESGGGVGSETSQSVAFATIRPGD